MKPGFKQTEVGVIPEDWVESAVGTIAIKIGSGITPTGGSNRYKDFGRPFMRSQNVGWGHLLLDDLTFIDNDTHNQFPSTEIIKRDVLLNITGASIGRTAIADERLVGGNVNQHVCIIRVDTLRAHPEFIHLLLLSTLGQSQIDSFQAGGNRQGLNFQQIASIILALPPNLAEQEAIASALGDADALIESLERLIAKKREIKQGAMQELLTARRRLPGFTGEWAEKRLDSLFDFGKGVSAPRDKLSSTGHCYLHYGDIHTSTKTHVNVAAEQHELPRLDIPLQRVSPASLLEDGDVVFVDASEDDAGTSRHVVVFNPGRIPFISGLHTIVAKSKTDELVRSYRCYCFQTAEVQRQFIHYAVGTKVSGISKGNLGKITVRIPKPEEQTAIAAVLSNMDAELAALESKLAKARAIKQGMMQELLTGKIRLVSTASGKTPMPARETSPQGATQPHNWQINEAVVIAVLAKYFGSEQWPLGRKRYTKLAYLFHRHVEQRADGFLKKAAGPYNPAMKYKGPEGIALKNRYIRKHVRDQFEGFVADDRVAQAEEYFSRWYGNDVLGWLEQFRKKRNDELELIATVDMAMEELHRSELPAELATVKQMIQNTPEWAAKLQREIFSDANITLAINTCIKLFA